MCAGRAYWTDQAIGRGKGHIDHRPLPSRVRLAPADTLPPHWTRGDLPFPIHLKGGHHEARSGLGLPTSVLIDRPEEVHLKLLAGNQVLSTGVACIDEVLVWQKVMGSKPLLNVGKLYNVGNGGSRGLRPG